MAIESLKGHILATCVPKGRSVHYVKEEGLTRTTPALCGKVPGREWWVSPSQLPSEPLCGACLAKRTQMEKIIASGGDPATSTVICAHCGKPSDRGFIQACRACSGIS